jgi:hypothetical protein
MGARLRLVLVLLAAGLSGRAAAAQPPLDRRPDNFFSPCAGDGGFVTELTADSITLTYVGFRQEIVTTHDAAGRPVHTEIRQIPPPPPKTYTLGEELAAGRMPRTASDRDTYRITDVQIGDVVSIEWNRINGIEFCQAIRIYRRYGGRVPPAPREPPDARYKWHEECQAIQDWEERGIPIPTKYHPGGPQAGVAPPPRPAGMRPEPDRSRIPPAAP